MPVVTSIMVFAMAVLVICGWLWQVPALVQLDPSFAPMQFNTALCLALLAAAVGSAATDHDRVAHGLAVLAAVIPALTLLQYANDRTFGIDTLFVEPFTTTKTSHPGRMAPTTAICFLLCVSALLLDGIRTQTSIAATAAILAAVALGISASTLMGYLFGLDTSYGWAQLTRMALHTAAGIAVLSIAISTLPLTRGCDRPALTIWSNGTIGVALVVMVLTFWHILRDNQRQDLQRVLAARAEQFVQAVDGQMRNQQRALQRMASRWAVRGGTPETEWRADAREYIHGEPVLRAVEWVDRDLIVRWVEPLEGNEAAVGMPVAFEPVRARQLQRAIAGRETRLSPVLSLRQGGLGILVQSPLQVGDRFEGLLVSVVQLDRLLASLISSLNEQGIVTAVFDGDRLIAGRAESDGASAAHRKSLQLDEDVRLEIVLIPSEGNSSTLGLAMSDLLLVVSLLLCGALVVAFHYARHASARGAALEIERRRLADVIAATNAGTWEWDLDSGAIIVNERWAQMIGLPYIAVVDRELWRSLAHPDDVARIEQLAADHIAGHTPGFEGDYRLRHRDGRWIWVQARGRVVRREADGRPLLVSGTNTDISDRKAIEESLRLSQRRFSQAFETAAQGMALVGIDDTWVEVNASLCRLLGYPREELLRSDPHALVHPDDLAEHRRLTDDVIAGARDDYQIEQRYLHRDGHAIWVLLSVSLVRDDASAPLYFIFQLLDITSRRRVDAMKTQFVSTVSHELRTPLTSISGALGLVLGGALGEVPEAMRGMLAVARQNCERLNQLINDLLDLEKLEAGLLPIQLTRAALRAETEMAVAVNQGYADKLGVKFVIAEADDGDADVDRLRLQQVLANLLSNAAKFSVAAGTVTIRVRRHAARIRFSVHNEGEGIAPEFRGRIFQKFSQGDSADTRQRGGTGLGLAISKELVERMGGTIGFESEPGRGATFWVEFAHAATREKT